jgi:hypothetical protein
MKNQPKLARKGMNMKTALLTILALAIAMPAMAADKGLTSVEAEHAVLRVAHAYLSRNAPDWGGSVHSPCATTISAGDYTVVCEGVADMTTGGDGDVKVPFQCEGIFTSTKDDLYVQVKPIHCK